jgi:hypothetical protein
MSLKTRTQFQRTLRKVKQPHTGWTDVFPAVLGKADGTVQTGTPGEIYVRNSVNGQVVVVHNNGNVPSIPNLQVEVGRRIDRPSIWQIKGQLESYNVPAGGDIIVGYHADQHRFGEADTVWVDRKQILALTVLVKDAANFIVQVYGSAAQTKNGMILIQSQEVDLSSYVPTSGAKYVSLVAEADGTLSVVDGTEFASRELATASDIPLPAFDQYLLAFVLLYEAQETLLNDEIRVPFPLDANYLLDATEFTEILTGVENIWDAFLALDTHTHASITENQYRQLVWIVDGDELTFATADGEAVYTLEELE